METPSLHTTSGRNIVLAYKRGPVHTHYLGLYGCTLTALRVTNLEFDKEYSPWERNTVKDFAFKYSTSSRSSLIGLTGTAHRVLRAIIHNSPSDMDDESPTNLKEPKMPNEETFRKPDGPVAQIHAFLDKKIDAIKAQTVSRKELVEQLEAKDFNKSTIITQCGVWARNNGIVFARPAQAAEEKKNAAASKRAAKKTGK